MSQVLINVENLSLGYTGNKLVSDLNLAIMSGQFWSIIGPNGQGKSTFIKVIMGLNSPLKGKVEYLDIKRNQIGYVPQSSSINPNLPITAEEFVSIATKGLPFSKSRKVRIDDALKEVNLTDKKKRNYWTLSGGERQRLHIARALVHSPSLLILDEPDTGLDFVSMESLMRLLLNLKEKRQLAVMMITHNLKTAERFSDKCALFSQNGTVKAGNVKNVLTNENIIDAFPASEGNTLNFWFNHEGADGD